MLIFFLGCYVLKDFGKDGVFLGKIVFYEIGLYRVEYEDGDFEDMESGDFCFFFIEDCSSLEDELCF